MDAGASSEADCAAEEGGGLSRLGSALVDRLVELGVMLDLAHASCGTRRGASDLDRVRHEVRVQGFDGDDRLARERELALDHRHQPLVGEALEVLRRLPDVDDVEAVVLRPGDVRQAAGGPVDLPADAPTRLLLLVDADLGPVHDHDGRHLRTSSS